MTPTSGRGRRDPAHPVDLLDRPGLDLLRHAGRFDLLAQLVDLGLLRVVLTQLALDGLELLAQDVLALGLVHLRLDLGLDAALQLEDLDLVREEVRDELQALDDVDRLEQLLALLGGHVRAVGDHVGQQPRLGDVARGDRRLRAAPARRWRRTARSGPGPCASAPGPRGRRAWRPAAPRSWPAGTARSGRSRAARSRDWPWTMARTVPSWSWTTWAILARVPTVYSSEGSSMSSCSAWRWVTSAMGPPSATAALSALTLFSRPTWSGTIISGKMTVSRSATRGSSRGPDAVAGSGSAPRPGWTVAWPSIGFS